MFFGFINICRIDTKETRIKIACLSSNFIAFIYTLVIMLKLVEFRAYVSFIDLLILLVLSSIHLTPVFQSEQGPVVM
jgi:hypothetical protein